jgi:hypothetical protein
VVNESHNPLKELFSKSIEGTISKSKTITIDGEESQNERRERKRIERELEKEEDRRAQEEREREEAEEEERFRQQREAEEEEEYNKTHCFSCGKKGLLIEFHGKYFHEKCLNEFKNSDNGKRWISDQEKKKEELHIWHEKYQQVISIAKKYENIFPYWSDGFNEYAGLKKYSNNDHAIIHADIDKFAMFMEEKYFQKQAEQKEAERLKQEAEEKTRLEVENKKSKTENTAYNKNAHFCYRNVIFIGLQRCLGTDV